MVREALMHRKHLIYQKEAAKVNSGDFEDVPF